MMYWTDTDSIPDSGTIRDNGFGLWSVQDDGFEVPK